MGISPPRSVELTSPPLASLQICGAPGDRSCEEAPCGGALCRNGTGTRHCGGMGCAGALPVSARALSSARNTSEQLEEALGQLGVVAQKVGVVAPLTLFGVPLCPLLCPACALSMLLWCPFPCPTYAFSMPPCMSPCMSLL